MFSLCQAQLISLVGFASAGSLWWLRLPQPVTLLSSLIFILFKEWVALLAFKGFNWCSSSCNHHHCSLFFRSGLLVSTSGHWMCYRTLPFRKCDSTKTRFLAFTSQSLTYAVPSVMNQWNARELTAPLYVVWAIGFKVVFQLFLLLDCFLANLFHLCLASSWLESKKLDVLKLKLKLELDNESDSLSSSLSHSFMRRPMAWPI